MTKMKWVELIKWANANGWFQFSNGWPKNPSTVILTEGWARPNGIPTTFYSVGWDEDEDGLSIPIRIFKSLKQASKFARIMSKRFGVKVKSMLH